VSGRYLAETHVSMVRAFAICWSVRVLLSLLGLFLL